MQSHPRVLSFLNGYLAIELSGLKQYLLHACTCHHWGYAKLADKQRAYSEEEARHAFEVTRRVLFLEGRPELADARKTDVAASVREQLRLDADLVMRAIVHLREAIACALECRDHASRDLFERMLVDEEDHLRWLESQLTLIEQAGLPQYLQKQM